jgi:hypothetical protein
MTGAPLFGADAFDCGAGFFFRFNRRAIADEFRFLLLNETRALAK